MTFSVTFHTHVRDIPQAFWDSCFPAPHEGYFWYETLDSCGLEDQFSFFYALISQENQPVAIAPCFVHHVPISLIAPPLVAWAIRLLTPIRPSLGYQRTFFVGSPCSDEGRIGHLHTVRLENIIPPLTKAVSAKASELKAPMVVFKDFPDSDVPAFSALCQNENFFSIPSYPGTLLALSDGGLPSYFKNLSQKQRHQMQKKLRQSKAILSLETKVIAKPSDQELAEIFGLFMQTYDRGKTKFEKLSIRFFERIRESESACFIIQRDEKTGDLLTFMLVFHIGDRVINKFIGLDYARAGSTYLYFRLFEAAVEYAARVGAKELQSGQTGYRAKLDLGHTLIPLTNICRHENKWVNALFRWIGSGVAWSSLDEDLAVYLKAHPL